MKHYDTLIIGHVSKDIIITPETNETSVGGAVIYSAIAAKNIGSNIAALTKLNMNDISCLDGFKKYGVPIYYTSSKETTSIKNTYFSKDRERRRCESISIADPFMLEDITSQGITTDLYYLGGLIKGEFPEELVIQLAKIGKVAVDVQGFLRVNEKGELIFKDWTKKKEIIPLVKFLKTDAAEAEILTGKKDTKDAARILNSWGAEEVMVTNSPEVVVYADGKIHAFPFTSRNLSGRTGRGDTCFSTYCNWRKNHDPEESCLMAAALTSLKMESPGPFSGNITDIELVIKDRY